MAAMLLTVVFSVLSNAAALLARNQTVLIGISQLITIPLMFLSSALMVTGLSAPWVANAAVMAWVATTAFRVYQRSAETGPPPRSLMVHA